ncbi:hypothetical protein [Geobacillus thermodenitrificans]|uniref:hypothetical protein n=1 Tax=Geobacillus thermodenitrificans TaxID=33940 RepID=UPI003D25703A
MDNKNIKSMKNNENINVKKRIMFNKDEDYYFITYNILIILHTFGCKNEKTKWIDYTKLSYLIPFVSDSSLLDLLLHCLNRNRQPNQEEIEILRESYIKSRLKLRLITSILFALEKNNLITLKKNDKRHTIDVWLNQENIPSKLLNSDLFNIEKSNIKRLSQKIQRIKSLSSKTMLEKIFMDNGVRVWES